MGVKCHAQARKQHNDTRLILSLSIQRHAAHYATTSPKRADDLQEMPKQIQSFPNIVGKVMVKSAYEPSGL